MVTEREFLYYNHTIPFLPVGAVWKGMTTAGKNGLYIIIFHLTSVAGGVPRSWFGLPVLDLSHITRRKGNVRPAARR